MMIVDEDQRQVGDTDYSCIHIGGVWWEEVLNTKKNTYIEERRYALRSKGNIFVGV